MLERLFLKDTTVLERILVVQRVFSVWNRRNTA